MSDSPPDGWITTVGTWGTDLDQNTSVAMLGGSSVEFKSTAPLAAIGSEFIPVVQARPYMFRAWCQAPNATTNLKFTIAEYDKDKGILATNTSVQAFTATNTWEQKQYLLNLQATTAFVKIVVQVFTASRTAYCAFAGVVPLPFMAEAVRTSSNQSVANSTWTKVQFNTENFDYGGGYDPTTNHRWTAPVDCTMVFNATVIVESIGAAKRLRGAFYKNGSVIRYASQQENAAASSHDLVTHGTAKLQLSAGDYVDFRVWQNHGVTPRTIAPTAGANYFEAHEVQY